MRINIKNKTYIKERIKIELKIKENEQTELK